MKRVRLDRRTLLRGAAISLALPTLDAMTDGRGRWFRQGHAAPVAPPVRTMCFCFPHGVVEKMFWPATPGAGYKLSPALAPLVDLQNDFLLVGGTMQVQGGQGGGHARGMPAFASAMPVIPTGAGGPSMDQVLAAELGAATKFRSIVAHNQKEGPVSEGATTAHCNNVSWSAPGKFAPAFRMDPMPLFMSLVSNVTVPPGMTTMPPAIQAISAQKRSVLDHVNQEINALGATVGAADRSRLDDYTTGLREIERQLTAPRAPVAAGCTQPEMPTAGVLPFDNAKMFLKLLATAFKCDLTRSISFAMGCGFDLGHYPEICGNANAHHDITHGGGTDADMQKFAVAYVSLLAGLMADLKATKEGNNDVLFNSLIYFSSEMAVGGHRFTNMPVILGGHAGGKMVTGQYLKFPDPTPIAKLFLTILKLSGSNVTSFGQGGTDVLPGIAV